MSHYDRLAEASRIVAKAMAQTEGLSQLEQEIMTSGKEAARYAKAGDTERAVLLGRTIDVGLRGFVAALWERPEVRDVAGDQDTLMSWVIAYFRRQSPELAASLPDVPFEPPRQGRSDA